MQRRLEVRWADAGALADAARAMSGLEFLRAVRDARLPPPPIAALLGFRLVEVEPDRAVFEIVVGEQHYNPIGTVHGGVAMTLLDSAMSCAVHTRTAAGTGYTTLEVKTNFVRPVSRDTGRLRAIGRVMHGGSRISTAEGRLEDARGKLYAHGTATCMVLGNGG